MQHTLAQTIILVVSLIIMAGGLVGIVVPFLPGIILIWTGIFLYAGVTQFQNFGLDFFIIITILAFVAIFLDWLSGMVGTKHVNTSIWGVVGAAAGGVIGSLTGLGWLIILSAFLGALAGEIIGGKHEIFKIELHTYTIIGYLGGTIIRASIGVSMIGLFLYKVIS